MSVKVGFKAKYGYNEIELPFNVGEKVYLDNAPTGLSDLSSGTFTLINQIPKSQSIATKVKWVKHTLKNCAKADGLYDKSNNQMFYKSNTWTAYIKEWAKYKAPLWTDGGYYALTDEEMVESFTVNVNDLLIFADIEDDAPQTITEFNALREKYKDCGGTVTGCEVYIKYKPNGKPWRTNHIEVIKA